MLDLSRGQWIQDRHCCTSHTLTVDYSFPKLKCKGKLVSHRIRRKKPPVLSEITSRTDGSSSKPKNPIFHKDLPPQKSSKSTAAQSPSAPTTAPVVESPWSKPTVDKFETTNPDIAKLPKPTGLALKKQLAGRELKSLSLTLPVRPDAIDSVIVDVEDRCLFLWIPNEAYVRVPLPARIATREAQAVYDCSAEQLRLLLPVVEV